jgi:hypothetical protein
MSSKLTILMSGMIAAEPWQGGATWAVLQYVLGLARLGHRVYLVEPIPAAAIRPRSSTLEASENAAYFRRVISDFNLTGQAALLMAGSHNTWGMSYTELSEIARRAHLLINISGMLCEESLMSHIPVRVYLDLDPAFNQLWSEVQGIDMRFAGHTHFVTIGQGLGEPSCPVPTCGLPWLKTRQPIVLDRWPAASHLAYNALTTVGNWRGYGSIEYQGVVYGQKAHSLRLFLRLPQLTREKFLLAMAIHPGETKDLTALTNGGWQLLDPARVAHTPASYQQFIQGSKAEFGIAKSGYAASNCGWFSDRSVCYLASGRPVIAQETGFTRYLPTGEGLFAFKCEADVLGAIEELRAHYDKHSAKAQAIAAEYFDSDQVLGRLLENVGF